MSLDCRSVVAGSAALVAGTMASGAVAVAAADAKVDPMFDKPYVDVARARRGDVIAKESNDD